MNFTTYCKNFVQNKDTNEKNLLYNKQYDNQAKTIGFCES